MGGVEGQPDTHTTSQVFAWTHAHKTTSCCCLTLCCVSSLFLSSPLLSCTAPDKQHQKQHSHQPQRKHPFTCSGIYLLSPPLPPFSCVCVRVCVFIWPPVPPPSPPTTLTLPTPWYRLTSVCLSSLSVLWAAVERLETSRWCQGTFPRSRWGSGRDSHSGWCCAALPLPQSVKVSPKSYRQSGPARAVSAIYPPPHCLCPCREAAPHCVSMQVSQRSSGRPSSLKASSSVGESRWISWNDSQHVFFGFWALL